MSRNEKKLFYLVIGIALVLIGMVSMNRIKVEKAYNQVQIAIDYSDVLLIARNTGQSVEEVLQTYKNIGANTLFVRENLITGTSRYELSDFKSQGKANVLEGYALKQLYPDATIVLQDFYIETYDDQIKKQILEHLAYKDFNVEEVEIQGKSYIHLAADIRETYTVGVGFDNKDLEKAAAMGYTISPQIRGWEGVTPEAMAYVIEEIERIPQLGPIYFASSKIPGADDKNLQQLIKKYGLGYVEFFSNRQQGFKNLYTEEVNVVRLHTLTDAEVERYTERDLLDRYMLAVNERNLRVFLFKLPHTKGHENNELYLKESIQDFKVLLEANGYEVSNEVTSLSNPMSSQWLQFIAALAIGLASCAVFVGFMTLSDLKKWGYLLGVVGFIGYAALLILKGSLAIKLMSLFTAIIFPSFGVLNYGNQMKRTMKEAVLAFIQICGFSLVGGLFIVGLLSIPRYMMGLDIFTGIKLAHLVPIVLVAFVLEYKEHQLDLTYYKDLLNKNITYLIAILAVGVVAVLMIYTSRTGNTGQISELEVWFRQFLNDTLGVRPRTKEFLIGHPILLVALYFGYKKTYIPLMIAGLIGQISIVNTYAHLHTPLMVSLIRSVNGIIIGSILGIILIKVIERGSRRVQVWLSKKQ